MAGITKAERERRQLWAETCNHWGLTYGPWRWYPTLNATARRVRCDACPLSFVEELSDVLADEEHWASLADAALD